MKIISSLWWDSGNSYTLSEIGTHEVSYSDSNYGKAGNVGRKRISEIGATSFDPRSRVKFHVGDVGYVSIYLSRVGKKYVGQVG